MSDEQRVLADGILGEAREEAEKIRADWKQSRDSRRAAIAKRISAMKAETDGLIERERERIKGRSIGQIETDRRRSQLRLQDSAYREVEVGAVKKLNRLAEGDEYDQILLQWTVEAGVGLAADRAVANCSASERDRLVHILPTAAQQISEYLGRKVEITLSADQPIAETGVVLVSVDGQTGYSNRVIDRVRRRRSSIRKIVHDALFGENGNG